MSSTSAAPATASSKMHSKHHKNHHHTMASTYTPHYSIHPPRTPTWPEKQASTILSLRDVSNPPAKTPDLDVRNLDPDRQIHARWTDPHLVRALSQLQQSLPEKVHLCFRYGGRDVTAATWITVHETLPGGVAELKYVLWFHEYDDLDVEVGELRGVKWGVKKEEVEVDVEMKVGELGGIKWGVKKEDVEVKLEDVEG